VIIIICTKWQQWSKRKWCREWNHLASFSIMLRVTVAQMIYFTANLASFIPQLLLRGEIMRH
jgi:hypothetical protein